ncbi:MAG: dGTP triphosphohydrolase [Pseudomonadota bacterium]
MDWQKLLSTARYKGGAFVSDGAELNDAVVHPLQKDVDRVLFSSAFRRLDSKTQVYIFPKTDFVRNRLTHSLEVERIGRTLATNIFKRLSKGNSLYSKQIGEKIEKKNVVEAVSAACLAHDIGNPPFGHVGEFAIRSWFSNEEVQRSRPKLKELMEEEHAKDFEDFDGNAQSFRIVTRLQGWGDAKGGLRLTAATLGALMKYPNDSANAVKKGKFGFYEAEREYFEALASEVDLPKNGKVYAKHPLALITEAADDIAYLTSDVEDAFKFGMVDYKTASAALRQVASSIDTFEANLVDTISTEENKIKFLRSAASLAMVKECADTFVNREKEIISGEFSQSLIEATPNIRDKEAEIRSLCVEKIYFHPRKVRAETGAYEVMKHILSVYSEAIEDRLARGSDASDRSINLLRTFDHDKKLETMVSSYQCYLAMLDYVSGMTDRFAMDVYNTLTGKNLSEGYF